MKLFLFMCATVAAAMANEQWQLTFKSANDRFSANLLQDVVKQQKGKSCVLSAYSVISPLAELAIASEGASHDEILQAIGFSNDKETKEIISGLNNNVKRISGVEFLQANKIYVAKDFFLNETFALEAKSIFDSEVQNIDFSRNTEAAADINSWVEDHTNKHIKDLVNADSIDSKTAAILVNAIYFKGKWAIQFDTSNTQDRDFHVTKDKTISLPMMTQISDFSFYNSEELDAKLLEMFYEGKETSLVIALPNKVDGIHELIQKLSDPKALNKALDILTNTRVKVILPKFKIETETDLRVTLRNLNVTKLFTPGQAKLNNLLKNDDDLYVSSATQKAFIEVNEEGTEAAAANQFQHVFKSPIAYQHELFIADHPFAFFLRQKEKQIFTGVFQY